MPRPLPLALDLYDLLGWLIGQWWLWVIIGVVVVGAIILKLIPDAKLRTSDAHSTTDAEANELALGYLQIDNLPSGPWNDPTAPDLDEKQKQRLVEQWGIATRDEWLANIERLVTERRRRDVWVLCLAIRGEAAQQLSRPPKTREWVAAIAEAGGDKRDARTFVAAVEYLEQETRKLAGRDALPPSLITTTFDGYAIGQAVALTTWGVALGHTDVPEARAIIHRINAEARPGFASWAEFGLSYVVGRVMHWSDGQIDEKTFRQYRDAAHSLGAALSAKRNGPWATLPWTL
ncbi:MAG: DUF1266 domain-containing protein [Protaetiibacter sp.]